MFSQIATNELPRDPASKFFSNPAYKLLRLLKKKKDKKKKFSFHGFEFKFLEKKLETALLPYALTELQTEQQNLTFQALPGKTFQLKEHHLSIYSEIALKKKLEDILGPFHHTLPLVDKKGGKITLHVYFDRDGRYSSYILKNAKDEIIQRSPLPGQQPTPEELAEEEQIQQMSEHHVKEPMAQLIKKLTAKRLEHEAELTTVLADLAEASKKGLGNETYLKLVTKSLNLIDKIDEVSFFAKYSSLKKRLIHNQHFAEQELQKQQFALPQSNVQTLPAENQPAMALEEEEKSANVQPDAKPASQAELEELEKRFAENKKDDQSFIDYFKEKKRIVTEFWNLDLTSLNDINVISSIVEREKKLEEERTTCMKQACRNHDLNTVQGLFDEGKDDSWLDVLTFIIFFYGDAKLLSWVYDKKSAKPQSSLMKKKYC